MTESTQAQRATRQGLAIGLAALVACVGAWCIATTPPDAKALSRVADTARSQSIEAREFARLTRNERLPLAVAHHHVAQLRKQVDRNRDKLPTQRK
jgi:hypothetical protein